MDGPCEKEKNKALDPPSGLKRLKSLNRLKPEIQNLPATETGAVQQIKNAPTNVRQGKASKPVARHPVNSRTHSAHPSCA
jgi:hypothetical protein